MAIDTSIYSNIRPVQQPDPLETIGRLLSIRQAVQMQPVQMQEAQEQLKARQLSNQEAGLKQRDDEISQQAYLRAKGDPKLHIQYMAEMGARPQAVQQTDKHYADTREQYAKTSKDENEVQKYQNSQLAGITQQAMEDPNYEQNWGQYRDAALRVNPKLQLPDQPVPKDQLGRLRLAFTTDEQLRQEVAARRQETAANDTHAAAVAALSGTQAKSAAEVRQNDAALLASAARQGAGKYYEALHSLPPDRAKVFDGIFAPEKILQVGMTPEQQASAAQQASNAAETKRHNLSTESEAKLRTAVEQGRLALERSVNGMKYGPGTQEYWVEQLKENPDSIKEMPPELRSGVGQKFTAKYGLPLPTPISGSTQQQETAARNALDGITAINEALRNPEIRNQLGPIMGRLQDAEQRIGTAKGLSPEAERLAQELRTRMRYFVFQEGKAVLGGRLPQQLMGSLEGSSANVHMDPEMLAGALSGAQKNAESVMDNADRQRFGGKMRPRSMRQLGSAPQLPAGNGQVIDQGTAAKFYQAAGNDPAKARQMAIDAGWKVQ